MYTHYTVYINFNCKNFINLKNKTIEVNQTFTTCELVLFEK